MKEGFSKIFLSSYFLNRNRLQGAKQNPISSTLAQQHQTLDSSRSQSAALSERGGGGGGQGKAQAERTTAMLTVNLLIEFFVINIFCLAKIINPNSKIRLIVNK